MPASRGRATRRCAGTPWPGEKSEGPATRLQWGASYFGALVDLAPQDATRIEQVARALFSEGREGPRGLP